MDDITRKFLQDMEARLAGKMDTVRHEFIVVNNKLEAIDGRLGKVEEAVTPLAGRVGLLEERLDQLHQQTMRKFQDVIDAAQRIGEERANTARLLALEARMDQVMGQLARLLGEQKS